MYRSILKYNFASQKSRMMECDLNMEVTGPVVVAQLVARPLPIPEVRGSNPVICKNFCIEHLFTVKIKEK